MCNFWQSSTLIKSSEPKFFPDNFQKSLSAALCKYNDFYSLFGLFYSESASIWRTRLYVKGTRVDTDMGLPLLTCLNGVVHLWEYFNVTPRVEHGTWSQLPTTPPLKLPPPTLTEFMGCFSLERPSEFSAAELHHPFTDPFLNFRICKDYKYPLPCQRETHKYEWRTNIYALVVQCLLHRYRSRAGM